MAEFRQVINGDGPCVIQFWAVWADQSTAISPKFEQFSDDATHDGVGFYKVDIDDQADLAAEVGITALPTFKLYKNGKKHDELAGANEPSLQKLIAKAVTLI
ncbi:MULTISPECIES: thioredoxin family protein [Streptomyces]